jgi:phospholipase C
MPSTAAPYGYVISRSTKDDRYSLWRFDPDAKQPFTKVPLKAGASFPRDHKLISIGGYLLHWSPAQSSQGGTYWSFKLLPFDLSNNDPLSTAPLQFGNWTKNKFWGRPPDFGNPGGGHKDYDASTDLTLISLGTFALNWIPTLGRGTYGVWSFDPCPTAPGTADPFPGMYTFTPPAASFRDIQDGHELIAFNNYVLDRDIKTSNFRLWSFDPQNREPLSYPAIQEASHPAIKPSAQLTAVGDYLVEWSPRTLKFRVWLVNPKNPSILSGPVREGTLPSGIGTSLTGFQPNIPIDAAKAKTPGTIDFVRSNVKHIVYYMLENRSFDHVVGWLHAANAPGLHIIGPDGPYKGASTKISNIDPATNQPVHLSKYAGGKLSPKLDLEIFDYDPYHDLSDTLRQFFYEYRDGYNQRATPDMGGFVWNNGNERVMLTYTPTQLPVLNGLAGDFAISDEWFCSLPASTDANRAFSLTGSSMGEANNFMSPPQYIYWPEQPHRPSIFKLLWCNGITNWRIYNSTQWQNQVFTYELFLKGQIPTVDAAMAAGTLPLPIEPVANFYADATTGNLPQFSLIEPVWIGGTGTTSYHPGADLVLGERQLNQVYQSIADGPGWENTMLVITFDEHGGIFDHVAPPYAERPWPHDVNDGFHYDLLGPRVPTIVISPFIEPKTVFRSTTPVAYDSTSFMATLLQWFGIPRERWFMGDRTQHAPSFEGVLTRSTPRTDKPTYTPPFDVNYPPTGPGHPKQTVSHLAEVVAHLVIAAATRGKLPANEIRDLSYDVISNSKTMAELTRRLDQITDTYS